MAIRIAQAVAEQAVAEGVAPQRSSAELAERIRQVHWHPTIGLPRADCYRTYDGVVWEMLAVLLIIAIGAGLLAPRVFRQRPGSDWLAGTLLITGVSPRPDAAGEQYVTITGVIDGPTVSDFTVYLRMTADVDRWPAMGELKPVVYSQRNPEHWAFAPSESSETPGPSKPAEPNEPPETPPTSE